MRPTIGRCSNRITSKTSLLTLNEQRNLRSIYQMLRTCTLFKLFSLPAKFFLKELLTELPSTVRMEKGPRQGTQTFLWKKIPEIPGTFC